MGMNGFGGLLPFIFTILLPVAAQPPATDVQWQPEDEPVAVAMAIDALKVTALPGEFHSQCSKSMDLLIRTRVVIEEELLRLASSDPMPWTRARAAHVLAMRGNSRVIPLLDKAFSCSDKDERSFSWMSYRQAIHAGKLPRPTDVTRHLALLAAEESKDVRKNIVRFLGATKARAAVAPLLKQLKTGHCDSAMEALSEIGDPRAGPAIIAKYSENVYGHQIITYLGKLGSPEAVDFLIAHLDAYQAPESLCATRGERALPALRAHLEKIRKKPAPNELNLSATRIAIVRLSHADPREALMAIFEDRQESAQARSDAFRALQDYDTTGLHGRFLKLYMVDDDREIKSSCIYMLERSTLDGVTEAMMDHAFQKAKEPVHKWSNERALLDALNHRLGTDIQDLDQMRAHILTLRQGKQFQPIREP